MTERDPHTEPENSTVDDWRGQEAKQNQELADDLVEQTGGDLEEAERRFQQQTDGEFQQDADRPG